MLRIEKISLYHFRNYTNQEFSFDKQIVSITGKNGSGKTSILDAIHFLCFTKSYFLHIDSLVITNGLQGMRINGEFRTDKLDTLICIIRDNSKKEFLKNSVAYTQFSRHIGQFPCVFIAPDDTELITGSSEGRRKFMDTIISQLSIDYLDQIILYAKILQQRNALLKQWHLQATQDYSLLQIYTKQLHTIGHVIHQYRIDFCKQLAAKTNEFYTYLSEEKEQVIIQYQSQLESASLEDLLTQNIEKDIRTQRTNYGIHKDDLIFELNGMPFKQAASQGQRKSFLFGLKLGQFFIIQEQKNKSPILLLDDIFEKLDESRSHKLIDFLVKQNAQIFITHTHIEQVKKTFKEYQDQVQFIEL